ncbi:hypothetical protein ABXV03_03805 [Streptomyces harbinensis]|uniref:hypothetical protein n=1 Tax=Streptomyces harbinensis TaxID=1176198 RepID=UPI00339833B5
MAKEQLGARVDADVADLARKRAADRNLSLGDYLAQLVLEDVHGMRQRAMTAADRFIGEFGELLDATEDAQAASAKENRAA